MKIEASRTFSFSRMFSKLLGTPRDRSISANVTAAARDSAASPLFTIRSELSEGASFVSVFGEDTPPFKVPPEMSVSNHIEGDGQAYLRLCNGAPNAGSQGITGGYSIRLPDAVEAEASGHHVTIKIVARAASVPQSRFALAYSTNEVGNSGWRWFDAAPDWAVYAMEWDVPTMRKGNGDFIGILPDVLGKPGTEFGYLAAFIN